MRSLFVSFTGLLKHIDREKVTDEQLNEGLFFFGCGRDHALHPENEFCNETRWLVDYDDRDNPYARTSFGNDPQVVHQKLVAAVLKAEEEGRCLWRDKSVPEQETYPIFQKFMEGHGVKVSFENPWLNYPGIRRELEDQVEVVY